MAKFIKIYNENPSQELIEEVVSTLKQGGLIIFPTDMFMVWVAILKITKH